MSTTEVDAPARQAPPPSSGGIRGFADRWPFRRKLNLLVGIPLAVVAVLLAYLVVDQVGQSTSASDAARLVRNSAQVATLVDRVEAEHQQAILLSVRFEAVGGGAKPSLAGYRTAQQAVSQQVERVRDAFGDQLPSTEAQALREVEGLTSLRETIEQGYLPADNIDPAYTNASKGLIDGLGLDRNASLAATFTGNLLDSLLRADAAHSSFETSVFSARTGDTNALIEFINAVGAYELYGHQSERFARFATEEQTDRLGGIEHNTAQATITQHYAELQIDPSGLSAQSPAQIGKALSDALADYPEYRDQSATRLKITASLIGDIADRADDASGDASLRAALLLGIGLLGFVLWIAFSVVVRRSVVRPVMALTGAAQEVAEVAGRELARVADDDVEDSGPPMLREMPVTANDEIGTLAEVFNRVQTTSIALLERQVLSRRNVAEMFGNVGRRVSNLTARQLALIDAVERGETDPELLERLYSIDHIAVRLRRNADSLMLLAGIRETVLDSGPTELTNVVRAALGQIEGFQRVRLQARTEIMVEPDIIGDLTLMVAELLENAVSFSPAGSPVEVAVRDASVEDGSGASIVIADHGLGMSSERIAEENARLIRRERLDLVPTKVLGLFVVGTLARRWEVDVTLSRTPGGGVTAEVRVPSSLLLTMSPVGAMTSGGSTGIGSTPVGRGAAQDTWVGSESAGAGGSTGWDPATASGRPERDSAGADSRTERGPAAITGGATWDSAGSVSGVERDSAGAGDGDARDSATAAGLPERGSASAPVRAAWDAVGPGSGIARDSAGAGATEPGDSSAARNGTAPGPANTPSWAVQEDPPAGPRPHPGVEEGPGLSDHVPHDGRPDPLPRRVPKREATEPDPPFIPIARTETSPAPTTVSAEDGATRPLRRRVRGATLHTTADAQQSARQAPRPADADAVRDSLDEFEAAVERANRDSTGTGPAVRTTPDPQDQNHLPEGAEQ
ncbi:ATP-binding protein [Streptomyces pseudovenezuelae]|uniref:histidine kinase n=1 Tax=Streptomyces pseudovenezuelae TaxID=67350 RepID=A0ABT6LE62_9ACTN|nr:ATP-binding protein [Streptomyces pseudovenezuelae]MDH6213659.1 signal transduction histidine kinase [Streptomyces pseudovenezuelae]